MSDKKHSSGRGFAGMSAARRREIASAGGRASQALGVGHRFAASDDDESTARLAGQKGGRSVSVNREHMAAIGRKGGLTRGAYAAAQKRARLEQETA